MNKSHVVVLCVVLLGVGIIGSSLMNADTPAAPTTPAPTSQPAVADKATNTKCPVSGEDIDPAVTAVYKGKTYAFCCADCVKAFNKDPEKYTSKAK